MRNATIDDALQDDNSNNYNNKQWIDNDVHVWSSFVKIALN